MMRLQWDSLSRIHEITKIDMWFLKQDEELYTLEKEIRTIKSRISKGTFAEAKQKVCRQTNCSHGKCLESEVLLCVWIKTLTVCLNCLILVAAGV